ncbi:gamma-glutamyltranspeptidase/glutathione hydrolase [Caulobacter ginsengisoli]|uniref:Glutathione hydrolase proenzyme n=1 Tax=Caulobacter ginsengisoli TaxID=400775 RepID=A0ABU0IY47_9CAUL|nr:gamma-glutamyltransferase [Caulobacter ginsengisoli]MDQ0466941.1 gamma-glutamyltranspeptidase/glutathione hydrolase [Caulobacter ginsengisoli]
MRRRTFLAAVPATAFATSSLAQSRSGNPNLNRPDVHGGDRIDGATYASRSAAWGVHGAAATAHPLATMAAIDILKAGGSAVDAAIAANACLGFLEPISSGVGGDCFAMLWDTRAKKVVGINGSGRSPRGLSLETVRSRATKDGLIPSFGAVSVSVPGAVAAWWELHQRYGKLAWKRLFEPAIALASEGAPVTQNVAYYLAASYRRFTNPASGIEEVENFKSVWAPDGRTPQEGEVFRNPGLAATYERIAKHGRDGFYAGETAQTIERYFKRIGGWMTAADLAAHRSEWTTPLVSPYRGVDVYGLAPNTQGLSTLQLLNILETFDVKAMGFQSVAAIHHGVEAKRLAYEDRARWFADPGFSSTPIDWLISKDYARERAKLIKPNAILTPVHSGEAPSRGDTTYFTCADKDGMMVSIIQSNYRGMGSGLMPDGLGFMFQDRGELFALTDGHPNIFAPGKRPFHTIIPGFAVKDGKPWLSFGVMGGDMQPQGQAQIISNMVDFGLDLQAAGDSPRWHHEGSSEPTGEPQHGVGTLRLETGVPEATRAGLARIGWKLGDSDGGFGGYQAIQSWPGRYEAATEMRKDGVALAY